MERTHCPSCGARLPDRSREMSNCLYCGFPFELAEGRGEADNGAVSPYHDRISRLKEHPEIDEALATEPSPGLDWERARLRRGRGLWTLAVGLLLAIGAGRSDGAWQLVRPLPVLGLILAGVGAWLAWRGLSAMRAERSWPLLARPCAVTDRRSVTVPAGLDGRTDYHFVLEFEDGNRAEFRWPGRGGAQEPMSTGITGVAYTRGKTLLAFRQLR